MNNKLWFVVLLLLLATYITGISYFLYYFDNGYRYYLGCAATYLNNTKPIANGIAINGTLLPGEQLPSLANGVANATYYYCGWHWKFKPSFAPTFELFFGLGNGMIIAAILFYFTLKKPKRPGATLGAVVGG